MVHKHNCGAMQFHDMQFNDLPEDIKYRVVQYLPYKDRVRFERIDKDFKRLIKRVFQSLTVFSSSFISHATIETCPCEKHMFRQCDFYKDTETDYYYRNRSGWKILMKCPNLRALYWNGHPLATSWGEKLAKFCPKIEHVFFRDLMTLSGFASYPKQLEKEGRECQIKCIFIGDDDDEMVDNYDDDLVHFFKRCPRLEHYVNYSAFNTCQILEVCIENLKMYHSTVCDNLDKAIDLISTKGKNLQYLQIREPVSGCHLQTILRGPNLKAIRFTSDTENLMMLADYPKKWESIQWIPHGHNKYKREMLEHVLLKVGRNLKSLELSEYNLKSCSLANFHDFCPKLEHLAIYSLKPIISDMAAEHICKITTLKSLILRDTRMTDRGIKIIFDSCPRIRNFSLIMFKSSESLNEMFFSYGSRHPKRRISGELDYGLLTNYKRIENFRTEVVHNFVICKNNVVLYYLH